MRIWIASKVSFLTTEVSLSGVFVVTSKINCVQIAINYQALVLIFRLKKCNLSVAVNETVNLEHPVFFYNSIGVRMYSIYSDHVRSQENKERMKNKGQRLNDVLGSVQ